jgi:hypothetical protein
MIVVPKHLEERLDKAWRRLQRYYGGSQNQVDERVVQLIEALPDHLELYGALDPDDSPYIDRS